MSCDQIVPWCISYFFLIIFDGILNRVLWILNQPQKDMNITFGETLVEFQFLKSHLPRKKKQNQPSYFSPRNLHTGPFP